MYCRLKVSLVARLAVQSPMRVSFDASDQPDEADRWNMGGKIRDAAVAPDRAVWLVEDSSPVRLLRLEPSL